ncbi:hypothetical protein BSZ22_01020 [Bradyrhizobium canariense]|uniref:Uncharacterized protein n=1 Tax=Bradyrhizobium canariense TaxID=255045 RepID=A0A1X3HF39_9BRAD|nr:hypothetical protein BSZ22_01020 [Bradyrhizobium canariense]OSI96969.1 hypothetical protein BSZ25_01015 [Bradyrhizobium canariense]OSI99286.1 hypothetical protein BSZ24_00630 [Bradyrhizobium canariense]OSJ16624.1 hypothetical protein BSZ16_00960 [Bradyrhizobium canariense]OSJ19112.1 hypothetical protein BSZ18_00955 [Bradyrhizobium canariense]
MNEIDLVRHVNGKAATEIVDALCAFTNLILPVLRIGHFLGMTRLSFCGGILNRISLSLRHVFPFMGCSDGVALAKFQAGKKPKLRRRQKWRFFNWYYSSQCLLEAPR